MTAGIKTLDILKKKNYAEIEEKTVRLRNAFQELFDRAGLPVRINHAGSLFTLFFTEKEVVDYASAQGSNAELFARFFQGMLARGINLAPAQFEAGFVSFAHTDDDIEKTITACEKTIKTLR
jgi:glutamate-1-semialdehyde 2,1-aminomutase